MYRHLSPRLLFVASLAVLLSACYSDGKSADQTQQPKVPAPQPFNSAICVNDSCAVIDQTAALLVPFDSDQYDAYASFPMNDTMLLQQGNTWQLADVKTKTPIKTLGENIYDLVPGYFAFTHDGKVGAMDYHGNEVQPARYDDMFSVRDGQYIGYELNGKNGILDVHGKHLTDALYDSLTLRQDFSKRGGLVIGTRGNQNWIINLKDGSQKKADYSEIGEMQDGHMVVTSPDFKSKGLIDASGTLTIPAKYNWLGIPSEGLVSFREKYDSSCGYMDYTGKIVIEPRFADCMPFSKKGAFAKASGGVNRDNSKYGVIDRSGAWMMQPTYNYAQEAGLGTLGMINYVPGYASVFKKESTFSYTAGIYDLNNGRELVPTTYKQVGVLTPDRFVFSRVDTPMITVTMLGQSELIPAVGVMDAAGKVLAKPEQFINIKLDESGHYLRAIDGLDKKSHVALLNLDGKQLIAPEWQELVIDRDRNVVFGYDQVGEGDNAVRMLRAAYDLQGRPLFAIKHTHCGAEQLVAGNGKVIWPVDPTPYCPVEETQAQASKAD